MKLIEEIVVNMLLSYDKQFYGYLLLRMDKILDEKSPYPGAPATLFTTINNGKPELHYSEEFLKPKTAQERMALIEHEMLHLANGHFKRFSGISPNERQTANIACDCAINQEIKNLPAGGVTYENLNKQLISKGMKHDMEKNREAEYYFNLLKERREEMSQKGCGTLKIPREMTPFDHEIIEEMITRAVKEAGSVPASIEKLIAERESKSKLNWKQLLQLKCNRAIKQGLRQSWKRLRRRSETELKGKVPDYRPKVVVAVDTSGSIFSDEESLNQFTEQITKIQEVYKTEFDVVECDTQIQKQTKLRRGIKFKGKYVGGGGTDFRPVFDLCNKTLRPGVLVFLTDGYGTFPEVKPRYPVIWVTIANNKNDFPFGEVILIDPKVK